MEAMQLAWGERHLNKAWEICEQVAITAIIIITTAAFYLQPSVTATQSVLSLHVCMMYCTLLLRAASWMLNP